MVVHASITLVDIPPLVDASRAGWWLDVQLWDRSRPIPQMLCHLKVQATGLDEESIRAQAREVVEHLVRWLALDVDEVHWVGAPAVSASTALSSAPLRGGR